jgi:hypothetical protein
VIIISFCPVQTTSIPLDRNPKFVISSWAFPDEYGQGIDEVFIYQYLDGSWESLTPFGLYHTEDTSLDISEGGSLNIKVKAWLNNTVVNAASLADGKNYLRHSVLVTSPSNSSVFAQQNFTYVSSTDALDPMFYYIYNVTLAFAPVAGIIYTTTIDYDIYYTSDYSLLDSDNSPIWGGLWMPEGSDGTEGNIFYSIADGNDDEDGAIETGITVTNGFGTVTFNLDLTVTAYNEQCDSIDITVMLWSGLGSGNEDVVYSNSLSGTGAVNITGTTTLTTIESFLVNITYVGIVSGDYVNMTIDSYSVEYTNYDWQTINSPIFYFSTNYSEEQIWLGNTALILLGMIMIPASGMYLVKGGRKEASMDKVFFALVAFMLGWALLIGGILP